MMNDVHVQRSSTIISSYLFGWDVICFEDETVIVYYEKDSAGKRIKEKKFSITAGYDLEVLKEAISLRETANRESKK